MNSENRYIDCPISQRFGDDDGSTMYLVNDAAIRWSTDRTSIGFFPTNSRDYHVHESFGVLAVVPCSDGNIVFCIDAERIWVYKGGYVNPQVIPLDDKIAVDVSGPVTASAAIAIGPRNHIISLLFAEYLVVLVLVDGVLSVQVTTCIDDERAAHMMRLEPTCMEMWLDICINTIWIVCNCKGSELNTFSFVVNDNLALIDEKTGTVVPINRGKVHIQRQLGYLLSDENTHLAWISALSRNINFDASLLHTVSSSGGNGAYSDCFGITGDLYGGLTVWENVLPPDDVDEDGDVIIIFGPKPYYLDPTTSYAKFGNGAIQCISVDYSTVTSQATSFPTVWVADVSGYVYCNKYDTQLKCLFRLHTVFLQGYDRIMGLYARAVEISADGVKVTGGGFNGASSGFGEGDPRGYEFDDADPQIEVQIIDSSGVQRGFGESQGNGQFNESSLDNDGRNLNFASSVMSPLTQHQSDYLLENKESMFGTSHSAVIREEGDGSIVHIVDNDDLILTGQGSAAFSLKKATEVFNRFNGHALSVLSGTGRVGRMAIHKSVASVVSSQGPHEVTDAVESLVVVNNLSFAESFGMTRNPVVVRHSSYFPLLNLLAVATSDFRLTVWHLDLFTGVHRPVLNISQSFEISEVTCLASHEMMLNDPAAAGAAGAGSTAGAGAFGMVLTGLLYVGYRNGRVDEFTITNGAGSKRGKPRFQAPSGSDSVFSQSQDPDREDIITESLASPDSQSTATDAGYAQFSTFAYSRPASASRMTDVVNNNLPAHIASHELKQYSTMEQRQSKRDAVLQRREDKKQQEAREKEERNRQEKERRRAYRLKAEAAGPKGLHSKSQGNLLAGVAAVAATSKPMSKTLKSGTTDGIHATAGAVAGHASGVEDGTATAGKLSGPRGLPPARAQTDRPRKVVAPVPTAGSVATGASGGLNLLELVHASSFVSHADNNHQGEYGFTNHWTCSLTHSISFSPLPLTAIMVSKADPSGSGGLDADPITYVVLSYCMQYIVVCDRAEPSKSVMKIQLNDGSAFGMTMSRLIFPGTETGDGIGAGTGAGTGGSAMGFDAVEREGGVYLVLFGEKSVKVLDCLTGHMAKEFSLATEYLSFDNNDASLSISKRSTLAASVNQQGIGCCAVSVHSMVQWQLFDNSLIAPPVGGSSALSLVLNDKTGGTRRQDLGLSGHAAFSRSNSSHSLDSITSSTKTMPKVGVEAFLHEFIGLYVTTSGDLYSYDVATTDQFLLLNIFAPQLGESCSQSQYSQKGGRGGNVPADRLVQGMSVFTDSVTSPLVLIWTLHSLFVLRVSFEIPPPPSHLVSGTVSRSMLSPGSPSSFSAGGLFTNTRSELDGQFDSFNGDRQPGLDSGEGEEDTREMKHITFSREGAGEDLRRPPSYEVKVVRFVQFNLLSPEASQGSSLGMSGAQCPWYRQCRARIVHASPMKHPQFEDMGANAGGVVYDHTRVHKAVVLLSDGTIQVLQY